MWWEAEAIAWPHDGVPAADQFRGWWNFDVVAEDAAVRETADALILTPTDRLLIEVKRGSGRGEGNVSARRPWKRVTRRDPPHVPGTGM